MGHTLQPVAGPMVPSRGVQLVAGCRVPLGTLPFCPVLPGCSATEHFPPSTSKQSTCLGIPQNNFLCPAREKVHHYPSNDYWHPVSDTCLDKLGVLGCQCCGVGRAQPESQSQGCKTNTFPFVNSTPERQVPMVPSLGSGEGAQEGTEMKEGSGWTMGWRAEESGGPHHCCFLPSHLVSLSLSLLLSLPKLSLLNRELWGGW